MSTSSSCLCPRTVVSTPAVLDSPLPTLECACRGDTASFMCNKGVNSGKRFLRCKQQICFTWIWEEQLSKYVEAMVEHKTGAQIPALREALEAAIKQVRVKEEQVLAADELVRAKDEQVALVTAEIASMAAKMEEMSSRMRTFKMLFWGLLFLCVVKAVLQ